MDYRPLLLDGGLHSLAVTWDSATGNWSIYVDGQLEDSGSGHQVGHTIPDGGTLLFGQEQGSIGGGFTVNDVFSGTLYDVRFFDDVRTADEIEDSYRVKFYDCLLYTSDAADE